MKVIDHIVYLGRLKGMTSRDARIEAEKWLRRMNLVEWANKKIEALSKGMAQKVQFIGTVVHRPPLMIFDEPFSGFDPVNAEQLKQEILELNHNGATILFSTHNMSSVEEVCDSISLINHSRVVLQGNVADVRQRHKKHLFKVRVAEPVIAPNPEFFRIDSIEPDIMGGSQIILRLAPG
ncbi:ABC transporter ATP-binding protein, partial [Muribaculum intestinale]